MSSSNLDNAKLFSDGDVWCVFETARTHVCELRTLDDGKASLDDLMKALRMSAEEHLQIALDESQTSRE